VSACWRARSAWTRRPRACVATGKRARFARWKGSIMLRIYPVVLEVLRQLQPVLRRIEQRDRDLGRQLRRCSASVALNLAEGMYSRGQNRAARYHNALGSARETLACLEVAVCLQLRRKGRTARGPTRPHRRHAGKARPGLTLSRPDASIPHGSILERHQDGGSSTTCSSGFLSSSTTTHGPGSPSSPDVSRRQRKAYTRQALGAVVASLISATRPRLLPKPRTFSFSCQPQHGPWPKTGKDAQLK
jgi:four helix bundle protein